MFEVSDRSEDGDFGSDYALSIPKDIQMGANAASLSIVEYNMGDETSRELAGTCTLK